jgi:hypothetical protein
LPTARRDRSAGLVPHNPRQAPRLAGVGRLYPRGVGLTVRRAQVRIALRSPSSRR